MMRIEVLRVITWRVGGVRKHGQPMLGPVAFLYNPRVCVCVCVCKSLDTVKINLNTLIFISHDHFSILGI
jgi:hypothetical protein